MLRDDRTAYSMFFILSLFTLTTGLVAGVARLVMADEQRGVSGGLAISSVKAFLYYHDTGTFSGEDLLSGKMALRNVIIGEGDAERPSAAMLVLVDVSAPFPPSRVSGTIKLLVRSTQRTLSEQAVSLTPFFTKQATIRIPFMVYRTGCERLEITATLELTGKAVGSRMERIADFACGE